MSKTQMTLLTENGGLKNPTINRNMTQKASDKKDSLSGVEFRRNKQQMGLDKKPLHGRRNMKRNALCRSLYTPEAIHICKDDKHQDIAAGFIPR